MSTERSIFGVAAFGACLYAIGGRDDLACLDSVEKYNVSSNRWSQCASMRKRRGSVSVASLNGFIYALGGHEATSAIDEPTRFKCGERQDYLNIPLS